MLSIEPLFLNSNWSYKAAQNIELRRFQSIWQVICLQREILSLAIARLAQCAHRPLIPAHRINFISLLHNLDKNESIMAFTAHV